MIDSVLVRRARQADLALYLISVGVPLVRSGGRYRHKEHDSLVIKGNMYYWNSRNCRGNSLDYLLRHMGMDFQSAVAALAGFVHVDAPNPSPAAIRAMGDASDFRRAFAYLHKTRGISYDMLQALVDRKLLAQEAITNNAVFHMRDEAGETVGAELEGTLSGRRYKGVRAGSKHGYGFNVMLRGGAVDFILFFESAVDLLSFADIKLNRERKDLRNVLLVSMCGLKPGVVRHMAAAFGGRPVLCPDNDDAAGEFISACARAGMPGGAGAQVSRPLPRYKDWNEQLLAAAR